MRPFNLDEYIKNPSKQVVTRDGRNVKILCTDYVGFGPIIAKVEGNSFSQMFYSDGRACRCEKSTYDLFFAPEKYEGWVNIYAGPITGVVVYKSEEDAKHGANANAKVIATIKIEWEE